MSKIRLFIGKNVFWISIFISLVISTLIDSYFKINILGSWSDFFIGLSVYIVLRYLTEFILKQIGFLPVDKKLMEIYVMAFENDDLTPEEFVDKNCYFLHEHQKEEVLNTLKNIK